MIYPYDSHQVLLPLLACLLFTTSGCHSWGWFSSAASSGDFGSSSNNHVSVADFSMDVPADSKGLVDKARDKLVGSNSCWQNAYQHIFSGCTQILANEEKNFRFAWHLSNCFQKDSGRRPFPHCDDNKAMAHCLEKLDDHQHKIYLEFLLQTNTICYQLQAHGFRRETERLVNELKSSAQYTERELEIIKGTTFTVLQNSNQIHESLSLVDLMVQEVVRTAKDVEGQIDTLSKKSEAVFQKSEEIVESQTQLEAGQERMNENLKAGVTMLHDAYSNLGEEVSNLRNEAVEIEKHIDQVGESMSSRFQNLQSKADDIEHLAGSSLNKQQELLDGQSTALHGLHILTESQSVALQESRKAMEHLADLGRKQQEELLERQQQLQQVHDHLVSNSKSILAAQEDFEAKQATMFVALDKLFALHNAMLLESRVIKAFFVYTISIFVIYMFTSTKQTYPVRANLYLGLCTTFLVEVAIIRLSRPGTDVQHQAWIINLVRLVFASLAILQILYAICTYRDYEVLTHQMILTLTEKIDSMQREALSWVTDSDDVCSSEDPDFKIPEEMTVKPIVRAPVARKYDLRPRCR